MASDGSSRLKRTPCTEGKVTALLSSDCLDDDLDEPSLWKTFAEDPDEDAASRFYSSREE